MRWYSLVKLAVRKMSVEQIEGRGRYVAAMVLAGTGDSLGYKHGQWEFDFSGPSIHAAVVELGGLSNLHNKRKHCCTCI